jgi:hypothetical protein
VHTPKLEGASHQLSKLMAPCNAAPLTPHPPRRYIKPGAAGWKYGLQAPVHLVVYYR